MMRELSPKISPVGSSMYGVFPVRDRGGDLSGRSYWSEATDDERRAVH